MIASGYEAGGHTHSRPVHTFVLVPSVCVAVNIPVIGMPYLGPVAGAYTT